MKHVILIGAALPWLATTAHNALAQPPDAQAPNAQAMQLLQQMPLMRGMAELQDKYQKIRDEKAQERQAITNAIYAEELARAKQQQGEAMTDPVAAGEWAAKQRLEPLHAQWKQEDQALENQMRDEMMNSTGMGDMLKQQQEMEQKYAYPASPPR